MSLLGLFSIKTNNEESSNFWRKSWVITDFLTIWNNYFWNLESLLFSLERPQSSFLDQSWVNPFGKYPIFLRYKTNFFMVYRRPSFLFKTFPNIISWPIFNKNTITEESLNFWLKSWVNPFAKYPVFRLYEIHFLQSSKASFLYPQTSLLVLFSIKTNHEESSNFWQKSWVNPFGKYVIFQLYKTRIFYREGRLSFLSRTSPNIISGPVFNKNTYSRKLKFFTKIMG